MSIVTKEQLKRLKAERLKPNMRVEYTINGPIHSRVVSTKQIDLENKISDGECSMDTAHEQIEDGFRFSTKEGFAQAQFNHSSGGNAMTSNTHTPEKPANSEDRQSKNQTELDRAYQDALRDMRLEKELSYTQEPSHEMKP